MKKETKQKEQQINYYFLLLPLILIMMIIFLIINDDNSITRWLKNSSIIDIINLNQEKLSDEASLTPLANKPVETSLQITEKSVDPQTNCETSVDQITKVNLYRQYLENTHQLIVNFLQNRQYHEQLEQVKMIELPDEVNVILSDIAEYTKYLNAEHAIYEKIFPNENSVIGQFVKIVKKSSDEKERELLRAKIISELAILTDFIYSKKLQDIFMNRNE